MAGGVIENESLGASLLLLSFPLASSTSTPNPVNSEGRDAGRKIGTRQRVFRGSLEVPTSENTHARHTGKRGEPWKSERDVAFSKIVNGET